MKRVGGAILGAALVVLALGCGRGDDDDDSGPTPTPTPSSFGLTGGTYDYLIHTVPDDTCWQPPKTNPPVPATVVADVSNQDGNVTVTPQIDGVPPQTFQITKTENDLVADPTDQDVDLNPQGLDCVLNVKGTWAGTMTADNVFEAVQTITLKDVGGLACFVLVGNQDPNQVDQFPCSFTVEATGTIQNL